MNIRTFKRFAVFTVSALLITLCACSNKSQPGTPPYAPGTLTVTFELTRQSGYSSNQFAVWIEDAEGSYVQTLYATRFTANGGYQDRPDSLPRWVDTSGLVSMTKSEVDAITGATPGTGALAYVWDLTGADGNEVPPGRYSFLIEGNTRGKNRLLYSGVIDVGVSPSAADAGAEYFLEESPGYPALSGDAPENSMITAAAARFVPAGSEDG